MDMQKLMDMMAAQAQNERSGMQMTLGELIAVLSSMPADKTVRGLAAECGSYRGYYCDLAFEPGDSKVADLLEAAINAINKEFTGYKGGEYVMRKNTPVWCASYGCCGRPVMSIKESGEGFELVLGDDE